MHNNYQVCPYCLNTPCHNFIYNNYPGYPYPHYPQYTPNCFPQFPNECGLLLKDYGSEPFVINIEEATTQN
ncbi:MAG: cupin domain-containing protein, partial [Peptococcales bacterium]